MKDVWSVAPFGSAHALTGIVSCICTQLQPALDMDDPSIVVLDYGSQTFRGGLAFNFPSEDEPRVCMPTAVTVQQPVASTSAPEQASPSTATHRPVVKGQIANMDQLEALIHHCLYPRMGWVYGGEGCVVLCEPLLTPRADRELLAQLMFEVFNVAGMFSQDHAVLSLYAVGKVSGSVVDIGHGKVDVATVGDGQLVSASVRRLPMAGEELDGLLADLLRKRGLELTAAQAEALKEQCMQVADSAQEFDRLSSSAAAGAAGQSGGSGDAPGGDSKTLEHKAYKLPDGQEVTVGAEGLLLGESLFRPELGGASSPGLSECLMDSVQTQYEGSFRRPALENMLVCGGGSGAANLAQRLLKDVRSLAHPSLQPALCAIPEYMPKHACKHAAWIGGAVLGKVVLSQNQFVTKWDYEEAGPSVVHRRCM